ncbi:MAG: hypothetical protein ACREJQ_06290 [bacterium]
MAGSPVACIDIGTYSTRLLIARVYETGGPSAAGTARRAPTKMDIQLDEGRITNLGRRLGETGVLELEAIEDTVAAVHEFLEVLQEAGAKRVRILATEAVRQSRNATALLERLPSEVEVLTPEREAFFAYLANAASFPDFKPRIVMDEGGGSTEITWGDGDSPAKWRSFPFGVVSLTEQYLKHDPPDDKELIALQHFLASQYMALPLDDLDGYAFIALGGTITSLAALIQGLRVYDSSRVHGFRIPVTSVREWYRNMASQPLAERAKPPVIGGKRARVMVAGLAEFVTLFNAMRDACVAPDSVRVSEWGIRHGALLELSA